VEKVLNSTRCSYWFAELITGTIKDPELFQRVMRGDG
jgi:hypothetical protein